MPSVANYKEVSGTSATPDRGIKYISNTITNAAGVAIIIITIIIIYFL